MATMTTSQTHVCYGISDSCLFCGKLLPMPSPAQRAAQALLFTDWATCGDAVLELELTDYGYTLHVMRGEARWEASHVDFETTDVDALALLIEQGMAALDVEAA